MTRPHYWLCLPLGLRQQRGAAALEYILVSTFAAVVAIAALGFVGKVVRDQLSAMAAKLGVTEVPEVPSPFPSGH